MHLIEYHQFRMNPSRVSPCMYRSVYKTSPINAGQLRNTLPFTKLQSTLPYGISKKTSLKQVDTSKNKTFPCIWPQKSSKNAVTLPALTHCSCAIFTNQTSGCPMTSSGPHLITHYLPSLSEKHGSDSHCQWSGVSQSALLETSGP